MGERVEFQITTPADDTVLRRNVQHALSLGHPEVRDFEYPQQLPLRIVANGPSALRFNGTAPMPHTMTLNGALRLFDAPPAMWAACDPQPLVADFLAGCSHDTVYFVASKCDPYVFDALSGHSIVVWHVWEEATAPLLDGRVTVGSSVSITNCAFELGAILGYRDFHVYGWDGCYGPNGEDHAVDNVHQPDDIVVHLDDRSWRSTPAWGLEVQDAASKLVGFPFPITIHGEGMMGGVLADMLPNRVQLEP